MFRYMALAWNDSNKESSDEANRVRIAAFGARNDWTTALAQPGLLVLCAGARPSASQAYLLSPHRGVILGSFFHRGARRAVGSNGGQIQATEEEKILETAGRWLVQQYWGRYVCILHESAVHKTWILRDPTGGMPCLFTRRHGVYLVCSDPEDCVRVGYQFSVDWHSLAHGLVSAASGESGSTGLRELSLVRSGECLELSRSGERRRFYWTPENVLNLGSVNRMDDAVEQLRETVRGCVRAWASCYSGILFRLSGGIDSSIALCCLDKNDSRVTCLNHYSLNTASDERAFARLAASYCEQTLIEQERDPSVPLQPLLRVMRTAFALPYRYSLHHGRFEAQLAKEVCAGAIFSGELGDAAFFQLPALDAATDLLRNLGCSSHLLKVAIAAARIDGYSVYAVLLHAIWRSLSPAVPLEPSDPVTAKNSRTLLTPIAYRLAGDGAEYAHPWLRSTLSLPPGKRQHMHAMLLITYQPFYDPLGTADDPEYVAPLMSQPIVELCLRIPTYLHITGGWSRSVARRAFCKDLPFSIVSRRTKGVIDGFAKEVLKRNHRFAREFLIDGELCKAGLLDRATLEEALSDEPSQRRTTVSEIYDYLSTEAWARAWMRDS